MHIQTDRQPVILFLFFNGFLDHETCEIRRKTKLKHFTKKKNRNLNTFLSELVKRLSGYRYMLCASNKIKKTIKNFNVQRFSLQLNLLYVN